MSRSDDTNVLPEYHFRRLFESAPGLFLVLSPELKIVAVTDAYLAATMTRRHEILGRDLFEVFPDNPDDAQATGVGNLRHSLDTALQTGKPHTMAIQKYDIRRPAEDGGGFEVRYWSPVNVPILDDGRVVLLIHRVEDVTEFVRMKENEGAQANVTRELRDRTEKMEAELLRRANEIVAARRNLEESKRIEELTRAGEKQLRDTLDSMIESVQTIGFDWRYLYLNAATARYARLDREEMLGKTVMERFPGIENSELFRILRECMEHRTSRHIEDEFTFPGGRTAWFEHSIQPVPEGLFLLSIDITERKRAELELQKASDRIREQLLRLQLLSQITRAISGRHDLASLFGTVLGYLRDFFHVDVALILHFDQGGNLLVVGGRTESSAFRDSLPGLAVGSISNLGENGLRECVNGRTVHVSRLSGQNHGLLQDLAGAGLGAAVAAPLGGGGSGFGVLLVARHEPESFSSTDCEFLTQLGDHIALAVTQLRLFDELRRSHDDLREAQDIMTQQERLRAMGEMASGIAHDINNALGPVTLHAEMVLETEQLTERGKRSLQSIIRATDSAAKTIAGLRHFYLPAPDSPILVTVDLNELVEEVVSLTRPRWKDILEKSGFVITVAKDLDPAGPSFAGWDGDVRHALTNLVFNALDAMPRGGTLTIRTRQLESEVVLEVSDTGAGMDESTRRRCLEPFFTTKGERGSGLGLAMVYGVMKRHGGMLVIESEPGRGTDIRLKFPIESLSQTPPPGTRDPLRPNRRLRLLCVDDDDALRASLAALLVQDGHDVIHAAGGTEAIARVAEHRNFDAVITDLGMPVMDGRELAMSLHLSHPYLPVILLTGWGSHLIDQEPKLTEFVAVLAKPPRVSEIRAALAKCCG